MEYEYMALSSEDGAYAGQCRAAVRNKELADKGWKNWRVIPWYESGIVAICVVRRELRFKDEPRMWTKGEIEKIAVMSQAGPRADGGWLGPPLPDGDSVLNECATQADVMGCLEDRNGELRGRLNNQKEAMQMQNLRIQQLQIELALAKEESNG